MTVNFFNKRTRDYYCGLHLHDIIYVDKNNGQRSVKRIATTMKCLDIITFKTAYYNIDELIPIKPIEVIVKVGVFLRRKTRQKLSKRAIYRICPIRIKKTKKEKNLGI